MIRFGVETSASMYPWIKPLTSIDFALAHRVLEDHEYGEMYAARRDRELILDNSMHELGTPLPLNDLLEAASRCSADYVITPDKLREPEWTLGQFRSCKEQIQAGGFGVAVVLCGRTPDERETFLHAVRDADMLCLPYREDRFTWYREAIPCLRPFRRIHLLGVSTVDELRMWVELDRNLDGYRDFSVDTSKPVKAGLLRKQLENPDENLRGLPISSKDLLGMTCSGHQQHMITRNIELYQKVLEGRA